MTNKLANKFLNKIILHFKNPILAFKFDLRKCYYIYSKLLIRYIYNIKFIEEKSYFEPDYCDLYNLLKIILKYNPKRCIEVGSGYSTIVIAKALEINFKKDNIKPEFYSLEQDEIYLKTHTEYIKKNLKEETVGLIKFIYTDLVIEEIYNQKVNICRNFPKEQFDFFYEDRTDDKQYKIAGDAIKIEKSMPDNYIICVDGMIQTTNFYKKNLSREYIYSGGFFHGSTWIPKSFHK